MLVAVLVFCPNYAQIMLAFQNYATFLKGIGKDRCASDTQVLIRELINTILQRDIFHISDITRPPPLVFSSDAFEASIPGKLCRLWSILSVLATL